MRMDLRTRKRVIALVTQGVSKATAAKLVGVTVSAVDGVMRRCKIKIKPPVLSSRGQQ